MFTSTQHQLLHAIATAGPVSRTGLVGLTGFSKASVSALSRELIGLGLLREAELVYGQGRPQVLLTIQPDAACFGGIQLRGNDALLLLSDLGGTVLHRQEIATPTDPDRLARLLGATIAQMHHQAGTGMPLHGIGVSVPGYVDLHGQRCIRSIQLGWHDEPFAARLATQAKVAVTLENDGNALAHGLQLFGPLRGCPSFSLVSVQQGIGCGHIRNGRVLRGHGGGAGELAHAPMRLDGAPCRCGKRGCLDTVASLGALAEAGRRVDLPGEPDALEQLAAAGVARAVEILHGAGSMLGLAVSQLIQILDPARLLVGASPSLAGGVFGAALRQAVSANVLPGFAGSRGIADDRLGFVSLSHADWAQGAASVAARRFLDGPDRPAPRLT